MVVGYAQFLAGFAALRNKSDEKKRRLMEKLKVNLFEGKFDQHGNYTPGKFELLTMPEYYKMVDTPP